MNLNSRLPVGPLYLSTGQSPFLVMDRRLFFCSWKEIQQDSGLSNEFKIVLPGMDSNSFSGHVSNRYVTI